MGCRKNLNKLAPSERSKFVNAFIALMDNGTTQEYADIHGFVGGHGHGGPAFFPWHREFVRRFELELQSIDPDVSLPYWDWTSANLNLAGTESLIWRDDFLGGSGDNSAGGPPTFPFQGAAAPLSGYPITSGPFAGRFTRRPFDIFSFPGTGGEITSRMASTNYNTFRQIEGPHGSAHVFIGGHIFDFATTSGTPDFWLIHCNVDRLWSEWIRQHESSAGFEPFLPLSGGPTGHNLGDTMWPWNGTTTPIGVLPWINSPVDVRPSDLLDHLTLGYTYDTIDACGLTIPPKLVFKERLPREVNKLFLPKERMPKELIPKERGPKEFIKEQGPKEFKEFGPKEVGPKEGGSKEFVEGTFIDPRLRPDLVTAGLAFEPDVNASELDMLRAGMLSRRADLFRR